MDDLKKQAAVEGKLLHDNAARAVCNLMRLTCTGLALIFTGLANLSRAGHASINDPKPLTEVKGV